MDMEEVNKPCAEYEANADIWGLVEALMAGTLAMRKKGKEYLPQEPAEEEEDYKNRLDRSFLFGAYKRVTTQIAAKPFQKPVALGDDVDQGIKDLAEDIDQRGNNLSVFAARRFREFMQYGVCHWLVDFPPALPEGATRADELAADMRPYWVPIHPKNLIGWRIEEQGGKPVLTQIRIRETASIDDGPFSERVVERVRVIEPDNWQLWEKGEENWRMVSDGPMTLGFIPLVTVIAGESKSNMIARPPLEDLAWLNLEHWQSSSDQRHILHIARVPILFAAGFNTEDELQVGPNKVVIAPDANAGLSYVEHSGAAIDAGRQEIQDIEEKMMMMGLELLTKREGEVTATQAGIEAASSNSQLGMFVQALQDGIELGLAYTAAWLKLPIEAGGTAEVFKDFATLENRDADIDKLIEMRRMGEISRETFFAELKRRGFVPDDFSVEDEDERIAAEQMNQAEIAAELDLDRAPVDAEIMKITAPPEQPAAAAE